MSKIFIAIRRHFHEIFFIKAFKTRDAVQDYFLDPKNTDNAGSYHIEEVELVE